MKVSVIVPVYNAEKYLKECIKSLINQTYKDIEIILIDDGSTDNSIEIINTYKQKDNRIKKISQKNCGAYMARINGINISTGQYLMFVDSDDWIDENAVEILVENIKQYNADIIKFRMIYEPKKEKSEHILNNVNYPFVYDFFNKEDIYDLFINTNKLNNMANEIIKRNLLDDNFENKNLSCGEDALFNYPIYTKADKILILDECLYHYRMNPNSTTKKISREKILKNINDIFYVYEKKQEYLEEWNCYDDKRLKCLALGLVNFISYEVIKLYKIKKIKRKQIYSTLKEIYRNPVFIRFTNRITINDVKENNYIIKLLKKSIINHKTNNYFLYKISITTKNFINCIQHK